MSLSHYTFRFAEMCVSRSNRNGFWWNENYFPMEMALLMQWNSSHRPKMHKKSRNKNPFKLSATPVPDLDQNRKRLFIKDLIPCWGTQGTPKRSNTLSNCFTQRYHRSTHRCLSRGYNPWEENSPRPQPNSYLEQFIMQKKESYMSFS